jgi:phosphoribosylformimino-5-aminoimidazole carboxamide ribotide isomerase
MRIIPVIDLKGGQAVHAVAGDRQHYEPVHSGLHPGSGAIALARAFQNQLGLKELYVADLDAIAGAPPDLALYEALMDLGLAVWLDPGIRGLDDRTAVHDLGIKRLVLGLETLRGPAALADLVAHFSADRLVFGLDLRVGQPVTADRSAWGTDDPRLLAAQAVAVGLRRILVLDLSRVGTGSGVGTVPLIRRLRTAHPDCELIVGGGVRGVCDLIALKAADVAAVLVASALHDGRIGRKEIDSLGE